MSEYNFQLYKSINLLEEVLYDLKDIGNTSIEEDIRMLKKGWDNDNGLKVKDICVQCQNDMFTIVKNIDNVVDNLKSGRC